MGKIKRVANAGKPPVIIPVIVVPVDIHVALVVVPLVESGQYCVKHHPYHCPLNPIFLELYLCFNILHQVSLFFTNQAWLSKRP